MAPSPKTKKSQGVAADDGALVAPSLSDDFTDDLIKDLNREHGDRFAYNLSTDTSPTHVKRWISTGSRYLDYFISNRRNGGAPEGRIIEIFGPPSSGKSHLAIQLAASAQRMGGIVIYIDSENATDPALLSALGVDVSKRFIYVSESCTENIFKVMESTILKAKARSKDIPILIIWDSVAASSPKAELEGDYDQSTIGLQARTISKGMRKITEIIGDNSVTLVLLNQIRLKVGVVYGSPETTPGGLAIPFHASVRLKVSSGQKLKDKDGNVYGIEVDISTEKNKVAPPHRKASLRIIFGQGISEGELIFDALREYCDKNEVVVDDRKYVIEGTGGWKNLTVTSKLTGAVIFDKKFQKSSFEDMMTDPSTSDYITTLMDEAFILKKKNHDRAEEKQAA